MMNFDEALARLQADYDEKQLALRALIFDPKIYNSNCAEIQAARKALAASESNLFLMKDMKRHCLSLAESSKKQP